MAEKYKGQQTYSYDTQNLIALGSISGASVINKFGRNIDVDTGTTPEDLWNGGGPYTGFPTTGSAEQLGIASSSALDTAAGSGARKLFVSGLDVDYNQITEEVTLNGLTEVFTTKTFWRVHTAYVSSSGGTPLNSSFAAGQLTVRHKITTANIFLVMPVGTNQSNNAGYTIPAGHSGVIKKISGSIRGAVSAAADMTLFVRNFEKAPRLRRPSTLYFGTPYTLEIYGGLLMPEKSDIHLRITSASANNLDIVGGYDLVLIKII